MYKNLDFTAKPKQCTNLENSLSVLKFEPGRFGTRFP